MKKLALLLVMAVMLCPAFNRTANAEGETQYSLSVSKQNGGILSIFNMYGNVSYSETYVNGTNADDGIRANLVCYGTGFTRCRVPEDAGYHTPIASRATASLPAGFADQINRMIEKSENSAELGRYSGSETKKVVTTNSLNSSSSTSRVASGRTLYIYSSSWNYDQQGNGTMTVTLKKTNPSLLGL